MADPPPTCTLCDETIYFRQGHRDTRRCRLCVRRDANMALPECGFCYRQIAAKDVFIGHNGCGLLHCCDCHGYDCNAILVQPSCSWCGRQHSPESGDDGVLPDRCESCISCCVCLEAIPVTDLARMDTVFRCWRTGKKFCVACASRALETQIGEGIISTDLRCPGKCCGVNRLDYTLCLPFLSKDVIELCDRRTLMVTVQKMMPNIRTCPKPDCGSVHAYEVDSADSACRVGPIGSCPECKSDFCIDCLEDAHVGSSCAEAEAARHGIDCGSVGYVERFLGRCPSCRVPTERTSGCPHMSCPCGVHWCWGCGGRHGPGVDHTLCGVKSAERGEARTSYDIAKSLAASKAAFDRRKAEIEARRNAAKTAFAAMAAQMQATGAMQ